jgi:hypothetical protein
MDIAENVYGLWLIIGGGAKRGYGLSAWLSGARHPAFSHVDSFVSTHSALAGFRLRRTPFAVSQTAQVSPKRRRELFQPVDFDFLFEGFEFGVGGDESSLFVFHWQFIRCRG